MDLETLPAPAAAGHGASAAATGPVLWLVRHGESTWNALGLAQGQSDQPRLTDRGALQARYVANQLRSLPIGAIYTSDLQRAVATAAPLAAALKLGTTRDPRLRERSLGMLEGIPSVGIPPALIGVAGDRVIDPDARPPGGESLRDLYCRVARFADDLLAPYQPGGAAEVAIVAHGGTLRVLRAYLRGVPAERISWEPIGNGTVVRLPLQPQPHAYR